MIRPWQSDGTAMRGAFYQGRSSCTSFCSSGGTSAISAHFSISSFDGRAGFQPKRRGGVFGLRVFLPNELNEQPQAHALSDALEHRKRVASVVGIFKTCDGRLPRMHALGELLPAEPERDPRFLDLPRDLGMPSVSGLQRRKVGNVWLLADHVGTSPLDEIEP